MVRNEHFNYNSRESAFYNDMLDWGYGAMDFAWTSELAGPDGAHYHCWIPEGTEGEEKDRMLREFEKAAHRKGDPVSFSWDYIPEGGQ